ncbi:hypothetical protein BC827DRAFT_1158090 [Russula dissimulans]|nr:hypothetical protein BC827DRAFT_1158090 [Russula dissimulans]
MLESRILHRRECCLEHAEDICHLPVKVSAANIYDDKPNEFKNPSLRPATSDEDEVDHAQIVQGGVWTRERWWYKLAQHLHLSLICTPGTPVAEMLRHSPLLPLIIDYDDHSGPIAIEDKEGIMLALKHRDRVCRIRLDIPVPNLQRILMALEGEFPILEFLCIGSQIELNTKLILPKSLRAPHIRHLSLSNFAFPTGSPLPTTSTNIVILSLEWISPSVYFPPNDLIQCLSLMPQLETLGTTYRSFVADRDVQRELRRPRMTQFAFKGASAYLEALLPCMMAPRLAKLRIVFFNQLTFPLPHLQTFLNTAENLRFGSAKLMFMQDRASMSVYPYKGARMYALNMNIGYGHLDWQVASLAQISSMLREALSTVEDLTLEYGCWILSSEWRNEPDRTQWRDLLRPFNNVKTLRMDTMLVDPLSHSLRLDDGESPMEVLPELKELSYSPLYLSGIHAFTPFIDARRIAGHPVTQIHGYTYPLW